MYEQNEHRTKLCSTSVAIAHEHRCVTMISVCQITKSLIHHEHTHRRHRTQISRTITKH